MRIKLSRALNENYFILDNLGSSKDNFEEILNFAEIQSRLKSVAIVLDINVWNDLDSATRAIIETRDVDLIILIGEKEIITESQLEVLQFADEEAFINSGYLDAQHDKYIVLKSSGKFNFNKTVTYCSWRSHNTVLKVDLNAITHNTITYKKELNSDTKLMVMVKAFAYGAGIHEVSKWLQHLMVDYFGVAFIDEGIELRQNGIEAPIMVMSPGPDDSAMLIKYDLEPEVYEMEQLKSYLAAYQKANKILPAHIMLNTGMNRLGFDHSEITALIEVISSNKESIEVKSLQTHLAAADEVQHNEFTEKQISSFDSMAETLKKALNIDPLMHNLNSAGIANFSKHQMGMVRLGIGLHGVDSSKKLDLKFPSQLKTTLTQIRKVGKGESIGYGRKGKAEKDLTIATIPIGYADGYLRAYGNGKAYVTINGRKAPTIGNVCMDMTMIDITGISAKVNDDVTLFGEHPTIEDLAGWSNTISYEVLTNISSRVQREYFI